MCLLLVSDSDAMLCVSFASFFPEPASLYPNSSSCLTGLIRTDEYTTDDFIRGREVSEIWTSLRAVVAREGKTG